MTLWKAQLLPWLLRVDLARFFVIACIIVRVQRSRRRVFCRRRHRSALCRVSCYGQFPAPKVFAQSRLQSLRFDVAMRFTRCTVWTRFLRRLEFIVHGLKHATKFFYGPAPLGNQGNKCKLNDFSAKQHFSLCLSTNFGYSPALGQVSVPGRRVSSVVERILGKAEVESSNLSRGTTFP